MKICTLHSSPLRKHITLLDASFALSLAGMLALAANEGRVIMTSNDADAVAHALMWVWIFWAAALLATMFAADFERRLHQHRMT